MIHFDESTIGLPIRYIDLSKNKTKIKKEEKRKDVEEKDPPIHIGGSTGK
jgi:hypothetical protein